MNALYNFAVGPLAWIAFTVCIGGPFSICGWRENPLLTVANFVLHIGILLAVLFYSAHNVMWDYNFGFSLPSLPDGFMDAVTLATILACLVLG